MTDPSQATQARFDPVKILVQAFSYLSHLRLMLLMLALGLCAGVVYFTFSVPLYRSTSLIYARSFSTPLQDGNTVPEVEQNALSRSFLFRFRSQLILLGAANRLGLVGENSTYEDVLYHVPAVRVGLYDATHVEVTVFAFDPQVVRTFALAMVEEYQEFQQKNWKEFRDEALDRYAGELAELERKVSESIDAVSAMERESRLTEITIEQQSLLEIPKKMVETRERIARMEGVRSIMESMPGEGVASGNAGQTLTLLSLLGNFEKDTAVDVGDVVAAPLARGARAVSAAATEAKIVEPAQVEGLEPWRELEKQKRVLEAQIAEASKTYLPDHQAMRNLVARLAETERGLATELEVLQDKFELEYAKLKSELAVLESRLPEYQEVTRELGQSANSYLAVTNSQKMWEDARAGLAQKLAAISYNEEFDWVQLRFKQFLSLRDKIPVSPSKSKLAMVSLIIGLAGAFGVPTLLNLFNTTASNIQQLEMATGINGIGVVPLTSREFLEEVHRSPAQGATVPNYLLECFRVIRANIVLHPARHNRSQVVLVTSSRPQEGKTCLSANLAWAFYSMGERTLLLDCDLRRGRQHALMKIDNYPGMTRMLLGECRPEEAIVNTGVPGFDVIPRGSVIPGTTELLCQAPFAHLMEQFRERYDRIVIDSPPVLGLSESSSLQRLVDGTALVIRAEKTGRKDVQDAITLLQKSGAHLFGFILNAVDLSKASNYYYYYYYSAPYYDQFEPDEEDGEFPPRIHDDGRRHPHSGRHGRHERHDPPPLGPEPDIREMIRRP